MPKDENGRRLSRLPDFEAPIREIEEKIAELKRFATSAAVDLSEQIEHLSRRSEEDQCQSRFPRPSEIRPDYAGGRS